MGRLCNGILAIRENEIVPFTTTWMDLEIVTLSEVSLIEKEKYVIPYMLGLETQKYVIPYMFRINIPYMLNLKRIGTNELRKQKETHRLRE